jgi:hypothetical protein
MPPPPTTRLPVYCVQARERRLQTRAWWPFLYARVPRSPLGPSHSRQRTLLTWYAWKKYKQMAPTDPVPLVHRWVHPHQHTYNVVASVIA